MTQQRIGGLIPEFTMGDRLRKARETTGLEQGEFANEIGVSRNTISNAETGARGVRKITLKAWALRTGVDLHWLETGKAPRQDGPDEGLDTEYAARESNPQPAD